MFFVVTFRKNHMVAVFPAVCTKSFPITIFHSYKPASIREIILIICCMDVLVYIPQPPALRIFQPLPAFCITFKFWKGCQYRYFGNAIYMRCRMSPSLCCLIGGFLRSGFLCLPVFSFKFRDFLYCHCWLNHLSFIFLHIHLICLLWKSLTLGSGI